MLILGTGTARLSPPAPFVWKTLMNPDLHPHSRGSAWPVMFDGNPPPRIVESSQFDRVVWSSPWQARPELLVQFDLTSDTILRWTLLAHAPGPVHSDVDHLREQLSHLVNVDLRKAFGQVSGHAAYRVRKI